MTHSTRPSSGQNTQTRRRSRTARAQQPDLPVIRATARHLDHQPERAVAPERGDWIARRRPGAAAARPDAARSSRQGAAPRSCRGVRADRRTPPASSLLHRTRSQEPIRTDHASPSPNRPKSRSSTCRATALVSMSSSKGIGDAAAERWRRRTGSAPRSVLCRARRSARAPSRRCLHQPLEIVDDVRLAVAEHLDALLAKTGLGPSEV